MTELSTESNTKKQSPSFIKAALFSAAEPERWCHRGKRSGVTVQIKLQIKAEREEGEGYEEFLTAGGRSLCSLKRNSASERSPRSVLLNCTSVKIP